MVDRRTIQRFEILEVIGTGGMGTVYRARDRQLERDVAIKVLRTSSAPLRSELTTENTVNLREGGPRKRDDLLQEARMMARLSHPNVVPIFEVGLDDAGDVFVVMEYVEGEDLRHWLETPRTPDEIARVLAQAARGLAAAHERGIVHRDFKPDNVLIGADGRARVGDFGIAKLVDTTAFVQTTKVAGTPKYMAPELWHGMPTIASDVFAFATACIEALGDGASPAMRAVAQRGISANALLRPALGEIIAALEGGDVAPAAAPRSRRRAYALVGAAVIAATSIGFVVALGDGDDASCVADPSLLAERWTADKRAAFRAKLSAEHAVDIDRVLAIYDQRAGEIARLHHEVCTAQHAKQLTAAQAQQQSACLELRAIELGAVADRIVAKGGVLRAEQVFYTTSLPVSCKSLAVTTRDPVTLAPLYARFLNVGDRPATEMLDELSAIETAARAAGDPELAVKAAVELGRRQRHADQIKASDETLQRAYREALAIESSEGGALALAERMMAVVNTQDVLQTKTLGALALDLAAKPTTTTRGRLRVMRVIARSSLARGENRAALDVIRTALDEIAKTDQRNRDVELLLRLDLAESLTMLREQLPEAIESAKHAVELARSLGEKSNNFGYALSILAKCYLANDDAELALETRRRALAVSTSLYPASHAFVLDARVDLGETLLRAGEIEAAHAELVDAVELASKSEQLRRSYPTMLAQVAHAKADLGLSAEAARLYEQSLDLLASTLGGDHRGTLEERLRYATLLFELGRLDEAERAVVLLEQGYARKAEPGDKRPALLRASLAADLALARGRAKDAEALARRALQELAELGVEEHELAIARRRIGEALLAQNKHEEARAELAIAYESARKRKLRADDVAAYEIALATAELSLGKRAEARARAERLRDVLAKFPGARTTRTRIAQLLAR